MYLTIETVPPAGAKKSDKGNSSRVSGVDRIDLDRNVLMNLWSDNSSMFGDNKSAEAKPAPAPIPVQPAKPVPPPPPAVKSLITIQTEGSFYYDMSRDYSHFERPDLDPQIPRYITVTRRGKRSGYLDLRFPRYSIPPQEAGRSWPAPKGKEKAALAPKSLPPPKPDGSRQEADMDMEWVHAWGKYIAMSSEAEKLDAYGYDLTFDAKAQQTVLKGRPMVAVKEGNQIKARELILSDLNDRTKQKARAIGPGDIGMGDFDVKKGDFSRHALAR